MVSVNAATEGTDFSSIEAQERAQIISELTFHLKTKQVCAQKLVWDDSGSGADLDGYFFNPVIGNNEYMIGGHASQKRRSKYHCVTVVSLPVSNPKGAPPLLVSPVEWKQVWKDSGSGATKDGSFWQAIPPDNNYKCIGNVSQLGHSQKPNIHNYRCVHKSLTDKIVINNIIWSDKGSGADRQVTIFSLPATGAYIAVAARANKIETYDLKKNAASVPDAKMVEEILAKRIAPLKADIEAKTRTIEEQKAAAKKEEDKNAAAKKAKQEKITAVKEKKRHAKAKQKALTEQTHTETEKKDNIKENKKALKEAEHLKKEQQARIAKAKEEKAAAELEKQKIARQEKESVSELEHLRKEEAESETVVEELVKAQPEKIKTVESDSDNFSASESGKESKGLNDILMFFVKVFGIMVGGVIVFIMAFKVLFSKKAAKK
jgi:VPS62-like protein